MRPFPKAMALVVALAATAALALAVPAHNQWPMQAGGPEHHGIARYGPPDLQNIRFITPIGDQDDPGRRILGLSAPVVADFTVYALVGSYDPNLWTYVQCELWAFDEFTGEPKWAAPPSLGDAAFSSISTPAIDTDTATVVIGNGTSLFGINAATGEKKWEATLERPVVNASAVVGNRVAYIADYDETWDAGSKLYAISTETGDILWRSLPGEIGAALGSSATYHGGVVYIATAVAPEDRFFSDFSRGAVHAFNAASGERQWSLIPEDGPVINSGFFGALNCSHGCLYGTNLDFYSVEGNASLWKLTEDGNLEWGKVAGTSASVPIVTDGHVILSTGAPGWNPQRLQFFFDDATLPDPFWESDPSEFLGESNFQLIVSDGKLYALQSDPAGGDWLMLLDAADPSTVIDLYPLGPGAASSPAVANRSLYIGGIHEGRFSLFGFGPPASEIPEPATLALLAAGALALLHRRRRA